MSNYEPEENESGEYEIDFKWDAVMAGAQAPSPELALPPVAHRVTYVTQADTPPSRNQGPSHYTGLDIQPWEAMESWMTKDEFAGFLRGSALEYVARAPHKNGAEDYRKAIRCLEKLLSLLAES